MSKYVLQLMRNKIKDTECGNKATLGNLYLDEIGKIDPIFRCHTLEPGDNPTNTPNLRQPILEGEYRLEWTLSNRNKTLSIKYPEFKRANKNLALWVVNDDEDFNNRRILIHVGNYYKDTLGCILLGKSYNKKAHYAAVGNSIECIKEFYRAIQEIDLKDLVFKVQTIIK
jgi:hypothetical protein